VPLAGWGDFRRCRAEPGGLYEVYFRYDDELEYWARPTISARKRTVFRHQDLGFPVVLSALFDAGGCSRACASSAIRATLRNRGRTLTRCATSSPPASAATVGHADHPPVEGETPFAHFHQTGLPQSDRRRRGCPSYAISKRGQSQLDPRTDRETAGQFESLVRFELTR
jgi:hypothetical protein